MTRLADFPCTEARRRETVISRQQGERAVAVTKGAPETALAACALLEPGRAAWLARVEELARSGQKVIGCARRRLRAGAAADGEARSGFEFAGLLAFEDAVRGVREAIAACIAAGRRVVIVTGDHPATAAAIGREIGLGGARPIVVALVPDDDAGDVFRAHGAVQVVARAMALTVLLMASAGIPTGRRTCGPCMVPTGRWRLRPSPARS